MKVICFKKKYLPFLLACIIVLCTTPYQCLHSYKSRFAGRYVGNLSLNEHCPFVYKKDSFRAFREANGSVLYIDKRDTIKISLELNVFENWISNNELELISDSYQSGTLYRLKTPLKGFKVYLDYDTELVRDYMRHSDCITIPNALYSFSLFPIELEKESKHTFEAVHSIKDLFWSIGYLWESYCFSYEDYSSAFRSNNRISIYNKEDYILYKSSLAPDLLLLYDKLGFQSMTQEITQYPKIIIQSSTSHLGECLIKSDSEALYQLKGSFIKKHYVMIQYKSGFLFCLKDPDNAIPFSSDLLEKLILQSNILIYSMVLKDY